jgi:transcriptional regulator with XRE-family HTH domain
MINIGNKIKGARKIKNITQDELAFAIGVSDKSISAYESGRISPPLPILDKIAKETNMPMGYFLEDRTEESVLVKLKEIEKQFLEIRRLIKKNKLS